MSLSVLIPYRPDTPQREQIKATTERLWSRLDVEVIYADDGLTGPLFSYSRAANRARAMTDADFLIGYNTDALPLPQSALSAVEEALTSGVPWMALFDGQRRFTPTQTQALIAGVEPKEVGPPNGETAMGREALLAIRADVWDDLRGMDERFVGWGYEDYAWHQILKAVYPDGDDAPRFGLFQSLWHPPASRAALPENGRLWRSYFSAATPDEARAAYLARLGDASAE